MITHTHKPNNYCGAHTYIYIYCVTVLSQIPHTYTPTFNSQTTTRPPKGAHLLLLPKCIIRNRFRFYQARSDIAFPLAPQPPQRFYHARSHKLCKFGLFLLLCLNNISEILLLPLLQLLLLNGQHFHSMESHVLGKPNSDVQTIIRQFARQTMNYTHTHTQKTLLIPQHTQYMHIIRNNPPTPHPQPF